MDRNEIPFEPRHLGLPSGASKMISEPVVSLAKTVHLSCTKTNSLQTDQNKILHDASHLGVPLGASKAISKAMVHLAQTMDLSCTNTNTTSKQTEMRFYMTHVSW
jgi:deoxyinosine 3'endonuclease (endonuclease V)